MTRNRAAFFGGLVMVALYVLLTACAEPTAPQPLVSCHPQVIQTPQGPWVTGSQVCDVTNPTTGQGHTEVRP